MRAVDLIRRKRDGGILTEEEIRFFVAGVTTGTLPDYQAAALLMAIVLKGMNRDETVRLTRAMTDSGTRLDLSDIAGAKVGKHSTGGVGDKVSIALVPLAASCGVVVPKISGRGLGHTGGTLDKLESIPGFRTALSPVEVRRTLAAIGCVLVGQTAEMAPADKKIYGLRDVTATVDSVPLIAASVMSKKLAEGIGALVLDVKVGSGAFMKTPEQARRLADTLVSIGEGAGVRTEALVTAMDAPLGRAVGNALEIAECFDTLKGQGPGDVEALCRRFAGRMIVLAGLEQDEEAAARRVDRAIRSGAALDTLGRLIAAQGGDRRVIDDYNRLPTAASRRLVRAARSGYLRRLDAQGVGMASVELGAGRDRLGATIDHAVGALVLARPGDDIRAGDPVVELCYRDDASLDAAVAMVEQAIEIGDEPPAPWPLVVEHVTMSGGPDRGDAPDRRSP